MTAAMVLWHRRLPTHEKYPLPPREIMGAVSKISGVPATATQISTAALLGHFGYGGAAGGLFGLAAGAKLPSPVFSGTVLGSLVWSLSYFGLLPALGIMRPATAHPMRRNALMLGAHFVWGTCLCALYRLLLEDSRSVTPALREHAAGSRDTYHQDERRS